MTAHTVVTTVHTSGKQESPAIAKRFIGRLPTQSIFGFSCSNTILVGCENVSTVVLTYNSVSCYWNRSRRKFGYLCERVVYVTDDDRSSWRHSPCKVYSTANFYRHLCRLHSLHDRTHQFHLSDRIGRLMDCNFLVHSLYKDAYFFDLRY